jgi:anhydro-N-acetylmuramic acid kinase
MRRELYIGIMSGTSLDGLDGVLVRWPSTGGGRPEVLSHAHRPFARELHDALLALNRSGPDEIHRASLAGNALAQEYAALVATVLGAAAIAPERVQAIGAHGQTIRHRPGAFDSVGYTVQLLNASLLAERTGIDVVCDFRSRDVAAGGQGAPLVPAFHAACLATPGEDVAVLNLGGIANLTLLPAAGPVRGFDTGPGNLLMDLWCREHLDRPFDAGGAWAAGGRVDQRLLDRCLAEPFFAQAPPKSTGRDLFDAEWLAARLPMPRPAAQDVMATLSELTATTVFDALRRHAGVVRRLWVCGGGAFNSHLMGRLAALLGSATQLDSTAGAGIPPDQVEALAFAWLARAFVERQPGNLPTATGAAGPRVLGALYPAR